jgi:hypothetical protein
MRAGSLVQRGICMPGFLLQTKAARYPWTQQGLRGELDSRPGIRNGQVMSTDTALRVVSGLSPIVTGIYESAIAFCFAFSRKIRAPQFSTFATLG